MEAKEMIVSFNHPKVGKIRSVATPYKISGIPFGARILLPYLVNIRGRYLPNLDILRNKYSDCKDWGIFKLLIVEKWGGL
ncbi:hypothetical protein ACFLW6_00940 [Chloroflexota bacterium]